MPIFLSIDIMVGFLEEIGLYNWSMGIISIGSKTILLGHRHQDFPKTNSSTENDVYFRSVNIEFFSDITELAVSENSKPISLANELKDCQEYH